MDDTINLNIPLTTNQLADLIRHQLPRKEQLRLASMLQAEEIGDSANEQILRDFRAACRELRQGTLKTRPAKEFLDELPS